METKQKESLDKKIKGIYRKKSGKALSGIEGELIWLTNDGGLREAPPKLFNEILKELDLKPAGYEDVARMIAYTDFLDNIAKEEEHYFDFTVKESSVIATSTVFGVYRGFTGICYLKDSLTFEKGLSCREMRESEELLKDCQVITKVECDVRLKGKEMLGSEIIEGMFGKYAKDMVNKLIEYNPDFAFEIDSMTDMFYKRGRYADFLPGIDPTYGPTIRTPELSFRIFDGNVIRLRISGIHNFFYDQMPLLVMKKD